MSEPVIQLLNVRKSFGKNPVLKGVNWAIERGQIFALLGRNGAGKTTAIRMLLGVLSRDGGSISVLGREPQQEPLAVRAAVGFLAEDQQMFGWMTIAELLGFMAPFYPTWDRSLADRFTKEFELPRGQRIKNLSKGQNVRLGLVLALAHRPELVILDDPALDVVRQRAEVAVTIENAAATIERLASAGVRHRVIDLNLDDIFAAYVIGKRDRPGSSAPSASVAIPA